MSGSPITDANVATNAKSDDKRHARWHAVRDSAWDVIAPYASGSVAIVGAGNADTLPLRRIARSAASLTLYDLDSAALERASERVLLSSLPAPQCIATDITDGNADRILGAIKRGSQWPTSLAGTIGALPERAPFDLVIGDMFYTQLFHPALMQLKIGKDTRNTAMRHYDAQLTHQAVARLHASSNGTVIHIHDVACWSKNHAQTTSLQEALADPQRHLPGLIRHDACDPHLAAQSLPGALVGTAWWPWPFYERKDFLVRASVIDVSRA